MEIVQYDLMFYYTTVGICVLMDIGLVFRFGCYECTVLNIRVSLCVPVCQLEIHL